MREIDFPQACFLKDRTLGNSAFKDSVFYQMYLAVMYSGIDTVEYTKADPTFIFLHTDAVIENRAGILSANGPIHVIDRVLFYQKN